MGNETFYGDGLRCFLAMNFQVFPPNCEVLLLDTAQREDDSNQQERKQLSERRPTFNDLRSQAKELAQDYSSSEVGRRFGCWFKTRLAQHHIWAAKLQSLTLETQTFDVT